MRGAAGPDGRRALSPLSKSLNAMAHRFAALRGGLFDRPNRRRSVAEAEAARAHYGAATVKLLLQVGRGPARQAAVVAITGRDAATAADTGTVMGGWVARVGREMGRAAAAGGADGATGGVAQWAARVARCAPECDDMALAALAATAAARRSHLQGADVEAAYSIAAALSGGPLPPEPDDAQRAAFARIAARVCQEAADDPPGPGGGEPRDRGRESAEAAGGARG